MTDTTTNVSVRTVGASRTGYFLSRDRKLDGSDIVLGGGRAVSSLARGRSSHGKGTATIPLGAPLGVYRLLVCADASKAHVSAKAAGSCRKAKGRIRLVGHPLRVSPQLERSRAVSAVIPSLGGGTLQTTGADGTQYMLSVPSGALLSPERITLTPIGSITGAPLTHPVRAGADLQPSGLELTTDATLTIVPPRPIPLAQQHAFAFEGNGTDFHRYALDPDPHKIAFHVTHFSGFDIGSGSPVALNTIEHSVPDVAPDQQENAIAPAAEALRNGDMAAANELASAAIARLRDTVVPDLKAGAESDDAINKAIIESVGWERQVVTLGLGSEPFFEKAIGLVHQAWIVMAVNSFNRAYHRCLANNEPRKALMRMMEVARWAAQLGGEQALGADYWDKIKHCAGDYQLSFGGSSHIEFANTQGVGLSLKTADVSVNVANLPLRLDDSLRSFGDVFTGGGQQSPLTVDSVSSTSRYGSCQEGGIWKLLLPSNPAASYISASFYPDVNFGVPNDTGLVGALQVSPSDAEDAAYQCSPPETIHNVAGYFSDAYQLAHTQAHGGLPDGIEYPGHTETLSEAASIPQESARIQFTTGLTATR